MEWKNVIPKEAGAIKVPNRWLQIHYYEALNILFRFENSLRVFVYIILKNEYQEKWVDCNFQMPGGEASSIKSMAAKRIKQSDNFGYLGFDIKAYLMHLTSGELVELITTDAYWSKFKKHFKGNKDIIKNKLLEIGTIRNSLAHFRPMKAEDIEVVKQNSRHTLLGVEECLKNTFNQSIRVPTNTAESWYQAISTLGTNYITTTLHYSQNEEWVNVKISFKTPILGRQKYGEEYINFNLIKLKSPAILIHHPVIRGHATYVSEHVSPPTLNEGMDLMLTKDVNIVFQKAVLAAQSESIAKELANILAKISEECDLLQKDNLARGTLVEPINTYTWWRRESKDQAGQWNHSYDDLHSPYQSSDADEYWGQHLFVSDPVAGCHRYPWMPESISTPEGFFD